RPRAPARRSVRADAGSCHARPERDSRPDPLSSRIARERRGSARQGLSRACAVPPTATVTRCELPPLGRLTSRSRRAPRGSRSRRLRLAPLPRAAPGGPGPELDPAWKRRAPPFPPRAPRRSQRTRARHPRTPARRSGPAGSGSSGGESREDELDLDVLLVATDLELALCGLALVLRAEHVVARGERLAVTERAGSSALVDGGDLALDEIAASVTHGELDRDDGHELELDRARLAGDDLDEHGLAGRAAAADGLDLVRAAGEAGEAREAALVARAEHLFVVIPPLQDQRSLALRDAADAALERAAFDEDEIDAVQLATVGEIDEHARFGVGFRVPREGSHAARAHGDPPGWSEQLVAALRIRLRRSSAQVVLLESTGRLSRRADRDAHGRTPRVGDASGDPPEGDAEIVDEGVDRGNLELSHPVERVVRRED